MKSRHELWLLLLLAWISLSLQSSHALSPNVMSEEAEREWLAAQIRSLSERDDNSLDKLMAVQSSTVTLESTSLPSVTMTGQSDSIAFLTESTSTSFISTPQSFWTLIVPNGQILDATSLTVLTVLTYLWTLLVVILGCLLFVQPLSLHSSGWHSVVVDRGVRLSAGMLMGWIVSARLVLFFTESLSDPVKWIIILLGVTATTTFCFLSATVTLWISGCLAFLYLFLWVASTCLNQVQDLDAVWTRVLCLTLMLLTGFAILFVFRSFNANQREKWTLLLVRLAGMILLLLIFDAWIPLGQITCTLYALLHLDTSDCQSTRNLWKRLIFFFMHIPMMALCILLDVSRPKNKSNGVVMSETEKYGERNVSTIYPSMIYGLAERRPSITNDEEWAYYRRSVAASNTRRGSLAPLMDTAFPIPPMPQPPSHEIRPMTPLLPDRKT